MPVLQGKDRLVSLHRQWRMQGILFCVLLAFSVCLPLTITLHRWLQWPLWLGVLPGVIILTFWLWLLPYWRLTLAETTRLLDHYVAEMEESSGLLLKNPGELAILEQLQAERVGARLRIIRPPHPLRRKLLLAAGVLGVAILLSAFIDSRRQGKTSMSPAVVKEVAAAAAIRHWKIRIIPPAYTGRSMREQESGDLQAEEGAQLSWEWETTEAVDSVSFIFNDSARVVLHAAEKGQRNWRYSTVAIHPGFYQVKLGQWYSGLYKIVLIKDEAPHIVISRPKPYTVVDYGEPKKIGLAVKVQDDYGITGAEVVATVASGNGEGVKFNTKVLSFDKTFTGAGTNYDLFRTLDLDALGLRPGDELYFYCRAMDNHRQGSESDRYIISLPDTAQLMSLEGLTTGVEVRPEYFRSERQIIIETEQLLKEQDTLARRGFEQRSNDLGADQQLLRLRYGKFLGEEAEEGGVREGFGALSTSPKDFSNGAKVLDAFTDKHDNAEDATYFTPAIKQQLKATLTEMWNAELRLRTFTPREALPYEYKALRLLKDLQQQSRAYVAKTGVHIPSPDPGKRLSGKRDDIGAAMQHPAINGAVKPEEILRMALGILEQPGEGERRLAVTGPSWAILQQASLALGRQAAAHPGEWLTAYEAMRRILGEMDGQRTGAGEAGFGGRAGAAGFAADLRAVQAAISKLLPAAAANPSEKAGGADAGLSGMYFDQLYKSGGVP